MVFTFLPNIPQGPDFLDFSWTQLLSNNQSLDGIFGKDHYLFSDLTANQGFHNTVTTPRYSTPPPTPTPSVNPPATVANPIIYAFKNFTNQDTLQLSRGPNNAIPTPITAAHGGPLNLVFNTPQDIWDFTGIARCLFTVYASDSVAMNTLTNIAISAFWNGTTFIFPLQPASGSSPNVSALKVQIGSANKIQLINQLITQPTTSVYFTIKFHRLQ